MATPAFQYLTESDVEQRLAMPAVIEAVENAFRNLGTGQALNVPRVRVKGRGVLLHSMIASADYQGIIGWKQYTTTMHGAVFHVGVYDRERGELLALIEANRLGQMRTGAVTAVAAKYLTPSSANSLALIGTGWQAQSQLEALAAIRTLNEVKVYSRDAERRSDFARKMSQRLNLEIQEAASAQDAVQRAALVITATSSRTPVLERHWLNADCFLAAIGSNWPEKSEIDIETVRTARRVVCDQIAACQREAGELIAAFNAGAFRWESAMELATIVATGNPTLASGLTLFKSVGLAVEDLAVAGLLLGFVSKPIV